MINQPVFQNHKCPKCNLIAKATACRFCGVPTVPLVVLDYRDYLPPSVEGDLDCWGRNLRPGS